ncbi:ferritin [Acetohalobium arabaticum]|uniref:Ferritin n=1 Tax=Acetohalobium arabaticum (strain ATCC 49924 / DSM 5501 / Z-7288) TaxID=574087 RepID=D9QPT0_ACEAZ|nr:ferritin [Acetohalobium arabaticum]ADL12521.1 Ferroxidase [Acetohalobium arabaticum DSM 5501]
MLSDRLLEALNDQMNFEFLSAHYYLAMGAYCAEQDFDGFAHFFWVQAEEERFHAEKFYNFINEKGERAVIDAISKPQNDFDSLKDVFTTALEHEQEVTKRIYDLMDIATEESEYSTVNFLDWFVEEQVEEEDTMEGIIKKIDRLGEKGQGIFMLDQELAQRTFDPANADQEE